MIRTLPRPATALCLAALLPLAGCISFGAKPPKALLTLTPAQAIAPGTQQDAAAAKSIVIDVPTVPAALAAPRIPVQTSPTTIAYVPEAVWVEPPARLFARLVGDTVTTRTGRVVVSTVQAIGDPSAQLSGELRAFGVDATARQAIVTFDAALLRGGNDQRIEKRRFEAHVPVAAIDAANAGAALNDAANRVAAEVADWIGR